MIHRFKNLALVQCDWCGGLIRKYVLKTWHKIGVVEGSVWMRPNDTCYNCKKKEEN